MPFGQNYEKKSTSGSGETRESPYLRLQTGERVVRLLDDDTVSFWQYFLDVNVEGREVGRSIVVGGADNPIRRRMEQLGEGHPKYRRPSRRFIMNVYDLTPVVREGTRTVYPDEAGKYSVEGKPVPNGRIMLMEFGPALMESLVTLHNRFRHPKTGEVMAIHDFNISIITQGKGRDTTKHVIPDMLNLSPLPDDVLSGPRYDLSLCTRPLPDEAQERLLNGEDYNAVIRSLGWESIKPLW